MCETDHELMRRIQRGDASAFEELVCRWQRPVCRVLGRYADGNGQVDDLAQEVFLRVFGARNRYRVSGAFSTWLFRIVLNVARSAKRRRRIVARPLNDEQPVSSAKPVRETAEGREQSRIVEEAVAALPSRLRDVLVLKHFGELTFAEVSRVTGLPPSTVKSRVHAALSRLRVELKRRGISEQGIEP